MVAFRGCIAPESIDEGHKSLDNRRAASVIPTEQQTERSAAEDERVEVEWCEVVDFWCVLMLCRTETRRSRGAQIATASLQAAADGRGKAKQAAEMRLRLPCLTREKARLGPSLRRLSKSRLEA